MPEYLAFVKVEAGKRVVESWFRMKWGEAVSQRSISLTLRTFHGLDLFRGMVPSGMLNHVTPAHLVQPIKMLNVKAGRDCEGEEVMFESII